MMSDMRRSFGRHRAAADGSQRRFLAALAALLVFLGVAALAIDLPVASWCKTGRIPRELLRIMNFSEVFAHTTGVVALMLTALTLDPGLRFPSFRWPALRWPSFQPTLPQERLARMICATATGGLLVDAIKLMVTRVRPRAADLASQASVLGTFGDAALKAVTGSRSDFHSFPSGHAAVAAGFAAALAWRYPRGLALHRLRGERGPAADRDQRPLPERRLLRSGIGTARSIDVSRRQRPLGLQPRRCWLSGFARDILGSWQKTFQDTVLRTPRSDQEFRCRHRNEPRK